MAEVDPKRVRELKINTGVVKRLAKEKVSYEKEAQKQQEKIDKMKEEGKDEHDIRKATECLQESQMMIPDCQRRLVAGWSKLNGLLESEKDLAETEEYKAAQEIIQETKEVAGQ